MQSVIYLVSNAVHMYAVFILNRAILGNSQFNKWGEFFTYCVYYAINCSAHLLIDSPTINLLSNLIPMLIIMFQYHKKIKTYVFITLGVSAVGMLIDWMLFCIIPDSFLLKANMPQSIMFLAIVFFFRHYFKRKDRLYIESRHIIILIIISLGTIAIATLSGPEFNLKCLIISIILLAINFLNFFLYDQMIEDMQLRITFNAVESVNKAYKNQLVLMEESQKRLQLLKHDMKNHFIKIRYDIEKSSYDDAKKHINTMIDDISSESEYVHTGNMDFDCFLNYKLFVAEKLGVRIDCNITLPERLIIDSFDLTTVLGNLLDNAINALETAQTKLLKIDINYSIGIIVIMISNTFNLDSNTEYPKPEKYGYGLISVETAVSKYNGKIGCEIIENMYVAKAVLCNIKKKY